ncbi:MAG: hypothetical protein ACHQ0J_10470 [Candidatus Dormibacterales bacterium]
MSGDAWICRIPRCALEALAAEHSLGRRPQVLLALLAALYGTRDGGTAPVSITHLAAKTCLPARTVRVVLNDLKAAGVLIEVEASRGKTRKLRLQPRTESVHGAPSTQSVRTPEPESVQGPRQMRAGSAPKARAVPRTESVQATNEEEFSEELFKKGPGPNGQNGHAPAPSDEQRAHIAAQAKALARRLSMGRPPQPAYEQQPERDPDEVDPDDVSLLASEASK